jgi:putative ABC transport system substrate-binding protein
MIKNIALWILTIVLLTTSAFADAQQPVKIPRIGIIGASSQSTGGHYLEAFRQGMRELGYADNQIVIEARWADGAADRFPALISELLTLRLDVLMVGGAAGALAAKNARLPIPVVFATVTDPLGYGLVESLARPGGNLTGVALAMGEGFSGKWVELLKEAAPKAASFAVLWNPSHPLGEVFFKETGAAGRALKVKLNYYEARDPDNLGTVLSRVEKDRNAALLITPSPLFTSQRSRIVELTTRRRLPSMFFSKEFVEDGGLMSYGPSFSASWLRAAVYVDKILKGSKPADLPVEQPIKFEFIVNLKAAKQIGLSIPPNLLVRADQVIR